MDWSFSFWNSSSNKVRYTKVLAYLISCQDGSNIKIATGVWYWFLIKLNSWRKADQYKSITCCFNRFNLFVTENWNYMVQPISYRELKPCMYSFKTKTITYHGKIDEKDNGKRQGFFVGRVLYVIRLFFQSCFCTPYLSTRGLWWTAKSQDTLSSTWYHMEWGRVSSLEQLTLAEYCGK